MLIILTVDVLHISHEMILDCIGFGIVRHYSRQNHQKWPQSFRKRRKIATK